MTSKESKAIDESARRGLEGTRYEASSLRPLPGGLVNWGYIATLKTPLDDGTSEVFVKHGEKWIATIPDFPLDLERCRMEVNILSLMTQHPFVGRTSPKATTNNFTIRTPRLLHFDVPTTTQVHDYHPSTTPLKAYCLSRLTPESLPPNLTATAATASHNLGNAIGHWLSAFSHWRGIPSTTTSTDTPPPHAAAARAAAKGNVTLQPIKQLVSYGWFGERAAQFADELGSEEVRGVLEAVERMAEQELREEEEKLVVVHGDFSTGNILMPDCEVDALGDATAFVIDWEGVHLAPAHFDIGQLVGELYTLWFCKDVEAGLWIIEGIAEAFEGLTEEFAFRVAIHAGAHLICMTASRPEWKGPKTLADVAREGRDIVVHAWNKDRAWFEKSRLACLFAGGAGVPGARISTIV